jgi:hypothetical protein
MSAGYPDPPGSPPGTGISNPHPDEVRVRPTRKASDDPPPARQARHTGIDLCVQTGCNSCGQAERDDTTRSGGHHGQTRYPR